MKRLAIFLALSLALALPAIGTAALADGVPWQSLNREERENLQKHRRDWDRYPEKRQRQLRNGVRRYLDLEPEQRRRVRKKHDEYRNMSPAERKRLREEYERRSR